MFQIARAEEHQIPAMAELWLEFMRFHQNIEPFFEPREGAVAGEEEQLRRVMKSEDGLVLVAVDEGRVVGFAHAEIRGPHKVINLGRYGALDTMAVTEGYRRKGVGEAMLTEILDWFRSKNVDRVELEVLSKNDVGYSFWKKHGFTDYRRRLFMKPIYNFKAGQNSK